LPAGNNRSTNANDFPVLKDHWVQMPETVAPERLLAAILGSTEDGLLSFALDGTIQTWSRGAERLYGYAAAEMTGQRLARLLPASEVPVYDGLLRAAINGDFPHCENRERLHKDGSILRVTLAHIPIRNEQGEITGILERGRVPSWSNGSKTPEAQLRFLAEQMPLALWTTDQNLRITSNWGAGLLAAKIQPGALVGRSIFEYLKCQDPHTAPIAQHYEGQQHTRRTRLLAIALITVTGLLLGLCCFNRRILQNKLDLVSNGLGEIEMLSIEGCQVCVGGGVGPKERAVDVLIRDAYPKRLLMGSHCYWQGRESVSDLRVWENSVGWIVNLIDRFWFSSAKLVFPIVPFLQSLGKWNDLSLSNHSPGWGYAVVSYRSVDDPLNSQFLRRGIYSFLNKLQWPYDSNEWTILAPKIGFSEFHRIGEVLLRILNRRLGEVVGSYSLANIDGQTKEREDFRATDYPLAAILPIFFGFFFFGWGWFWWKGLYHYPDGWLGYTLATASCICGFAMWLWGISRWSAKF
jgi:PAS domain S-box-containing protein